MSRFFVGQRVRILWSKNYPELIGEQGEIVAQESGDPHPETGYIGDWVVAPDCWGTHLVPGGKNRFSPREKNLAPVYDGHEKTSWDAMKGLWQPSPEPASLVLSEIIQ